LKVSAAASLSDVSKALKKEFEKTHKNVNVTFNYVFFQTLSLMLYLHHLNLLLLKLSIQF
jgi:hypothetical protein